jgi:hypothetical protein
LTTSTAGSCGSKSLSAITLNASYNFEELGSKPGTNSSNSRTIDGGCFWDKTAAKQTPGSSNTGLGGSNSISVNQTTSLTCNTINQTYTSSNVLTISPAPSSSSPLSYTTIFSQNLSFSPSNQYDQNLSLQQATITYNNLSAGYYNILFETANSTCGQVSYSIVMNNPLLNIAASTTPNCQTNSPAPNGSATITISNPSSTPSNYYPLTYSVINTATNQSFSGNPSSPTNSSPIAIPSLTNASYSITVTPNYGCQNSKSFTVIESCIVPIKLINFSASNTVSNNRFEITIDADAELDQLILESSSDAKLFSKVANIPFENRKGDQKISFELPASADEFFRIVMIDIFGKRLVSEIVKIKNNIQELDITVFPNPFQEYISLQHYSRDEDLLIACLLSNNGAIIKEENFKLLPGLNNLRINTSGISKGNYLLSLKKTSSPNIPQQYN